MRKLSSEELNRKSVTEFRASEKSPFIIVLDNIRSLNNVGSIFRTADAFIVEAVYLCGITATPPHREIQKSALGATESVVWKHFEKTTDAVMHLRESGFTIVSVEQAEGSVSLDKFTPEKGKKYALVFGHEVRGVSEEVVMMSDGCIEIPQYGTKHSFNVAVSAGIVLWHLSHMINNIK
ncbi:MAG: RNA methyltransferase [Bacteroidales bacterium]|jgi:tRNA G18 (ribose-2'-O)-methylase SpoU|nr:RNA methyltransferase [Bacteroidales bacterium]